MASARSGPDRDRRALLGGLLATAAVPALASLARAERALGQLGESGADSATETTLLAAPAGLEATLVTVYEVGGSSPALSAEGRRLMRRLGGQSGERLAILAEELAPSAPPKPPRPKAVPGLEGEAAGAEAGAARSFTDLAELALGFESQAYLSYLDAVGGLAAERAGLAASLAAGVAQHLALLRFELGSEPVPTAFETVGAA